MDKKIYLIGLLVLAIFIGSGCSLPVRKQNVNGQEMGEQIDNYDVEVRGLKLKYVLIDSAYEMYQFQEEFKENIPHYLQEEDSKGHYEWLNDTYESMSQEMKDSLAMIMTRTHPWQIMNVTSSLKDDASVEEVIECITLSQELPYNDTEKEQLTAFFTSYYNDYLKEYLEVQAPLFEEKARRLNEQIAEHPSDIMGFMEEQSGIKFKEKSKPVFYYTLRKIGAMGFDQPSIKISLIQRDINDTSNLFGTPFHEFGHALFDTFTNKRAFKNVTKKLSKQDTDFRREWESKYQSNYNWIGWCEENLVEGFATYLKEQYYGYVNSGDLYTYDFAFYKYLKEVNFNPGKMSLEDVSIDFYESVLEAGDSQKTL